MDKGQLLQITSVSIQSRSRIVFPDLGGCSKKIYHIKYLDLIEGCTTVGLKDLLSVKDYIFILHCKKYETIVNYSLYLYIRASQRAPERKN